MQVVNETTLLKTNNSTHKNAKFTKVADQFLSSSKVHSPTHLKTVVLRSYWLFHQLIDPTASEKATD